MKRRVQFTLLVVLTGIVLLPASALFGATLKPLPVVAANSTTIQPPGGPASDGPGFNGNPAIRDLRTDFVRTWHVFADTVNDAILDPGDTRVGEFKNWWTPVSAATQHGHQIGAPPPAITPISDADGFDFPSTPIDHQNNWTTNTTRGLPQQPGTIGFYLTYSHMDNANFDTEFYSDGTPHDTFQQRNRERNGYAMGWLTGETVTVDHDNDPSTLRVIQHGTGTGNVKMDIFIHNGKSRNAGGVGPDDNHNFGTNTSGQQVWYGPTPAVAPGAAYSGVSQSDPQVVQSNEMSLLARQVDDLMLVADYRDELVINNPSSQTGYSYGPNSTGYIFTDAAGDFNKGKYLVGDDVFPTAIPMHTASLAEFDTVIDSMDVREVNSYRTTPGGGNDDLNTGGVITPIHAADTPQALLDAGVKDGQGIDYYFYEDSFFVRDGLSDNGAPWVEGSTDGGVIAGLSGYDDYSQFYSPVGAPDPRLFSNWGEQQVIRIDFDKDTFDMLAANGISKIIFYDWGDPDSVTGQQTKPIDAAQQITINVDAGRNLYFDADGDGVLTGTGQPGEDIRFPENRIYIAQVEHMPEPATMIMLAIGGSALLARRRSRRGRK